MDPRPLLSCFAVASLAIAIWGHLPAPLVERVRVRRITLGLVMGFGAIASMFVPLQIQPGVIMDLRAALIGSAAFVGGPISAVVAAGLALTYRLLLGGAGVWAGCANVALAAVIGTGVFWMAPRRPARLVRVTLLSVAISLTPIIATLVLPQDGRAASVHALIPMVLLELGCTWLFALSLQRDERHRALIGQDAMYRAIIQSLPDSLNAKDRQSRFVAANPATARLMGVASPDALIGKTDADFYPEDMAKLFREEELQALGKTLVGPVDQEVRFKDGCRRWLTSMKTPLLDRRGRVIGIITHNRDVTDRKALEAELLKTQGYLQEAMSHMADGLVLYDREGTLRFCNEKFRSMFPRTAELRVEGGRFADIVRASVLRGEEKPMADVEGYVADRVRQLHVAGEKLLELRDGRSIELRSRPLPGSDTLIVYTDVTARKELERDLRRRASQDPLTKLANRATFEFQLEVAHRQAVAHETAFAVMMLDLDRFKPVNDTFGHAVGDGLLVEVAQRLRLAVRDGTLVARLGGDEFAFLIVAPDIETAAAGLANRVITSLAKPVRVGEVDLLPSGSAGIAYFPRNAADPFELLRLADKALYAVKTLGGGSWITTQVEAGETREPPRAAPLARTAA